MGQKITSSDVLLQVGDATFAYNGKAILEQVSFSLAAGEFVGLIGPNGAGKSTLLKLLGGVLQARAGEVSLLGRPLNSYGARRVARLVAHVPQSTSFDFPFTVREVVLMGRSPHLGRFQMEGAADRAIAESAMRTTDTAHLADRFVSTLSGGERQRVFIARALAQEPRVLLLDEPTSNLDIKHQLAVMNLVRSLAHDRNLGVIAAVHDLPQAARYCDRVVILSHGVIAADGTPEAVFTPGRLERVFGVEVSVEPEPVTGGLRVTPLRPAQFVSNN